MRKTSYIYKNILWIKISLIQIKYLKLNLVLATILDRKKHVTCNILGKNEDIFEIYKEICAELYYKLSFHLLQSHFCNLDWV